MGLLLSRALRLELPITIAFAGSGGKTTAVFQIARELLRQNWITGEGLLKTNETVIVTTSTHLGISQISLADKHLILDGNRAFDDQLPIQPGVLLITGAIEDDKLNSLDEKQIFKLHHYCREHNLFLLIEADGSKQRPLKAPADHEPAIPDISEMVVYIMGLMGLDKPLNETVVHRPEIFSRLTGLRPEDRMTVDALIRFLIHPEGGKKNIPPNSRRAIILNQADTPMLVAEAQPMVEPLLSEFASVVIASLQPDQHHPPDLEQVENNSLPQIHSVHEHIAGIILAAGESKRFGKPKQLLLWRGQPFIRAVVQTALSAHLDPIIVVLGAHADIVMNAIDNQPVKIVLNEEWSQGQSRSIRVGLQALEGMLAKRFRPESHYSRFGPVGGAVFLLADQPQITEAVITALKEVHSREMGLIIAPKVPEERRANPVFFDRDTFHELKLLEGDVGGRSLFNKFPVTYLPWKDRNLLLDVDQPGDYEQLISEAKT